MLTCSEVDDDITEENGVGDDIEDDPAGGEVVVEEANSNWQNNEVGNEEQQHAQVPIEPEVGEEKDEILNMEIEAQVIPDLRIFMENKNMEKRDPC